jgi:hypothetical protein
MNAPAVYCDACLNHAPPGTPEATTEDAQRAGACAWCGWPLIAEKPE